jgi:hypothetical protein
VKKNLVTVLLVKLTELTLHLVVVLPDIINLDVIVTLVHTNVSLALLLTFVMNVLIQLIECQLLVTVLMDTITSINKQIVTYVQLDVPLVHKLKCVSLVLLT